MHHLRYPTAAQERQWLDEVLHLHSLWRRGPPRNHLSPPPPPRSHLAVTAVSQNPENKINKRKGRRKKEQSRQRRKEHQQHQQQQQQQQQQKVSPSAPDTLVVEEEWPCLPSPTSKPEFSNWPNPVTEKRKNLLLSADDQARADAVRVQESGIRTSCEFFSKSSSSDDGDDDDDDDDEDEEDVMEEDEYEEDDAEARAFRFFLGLFEKDGALRRYYEKNWEKGEFFCFVCRATGMKVGKRFLNCVGLVQHSKSISKTKRREAHRGFANAVCRVMGWDMERLPSIVLDLKDSLGQSLAKADKFQERICEGASFDMSKQVAEVAAVTVETVKEVVGSSPSRGIESLIEGQGMHEQSSSDIKEVVNAESNKQVPVSSSPLRDMEAFPEEGKHKDGPSKMTEEVPKEVVTKEGDQEDLANSSPAGNMDALPEEEKIHENGSSDMNKEITNKIVDVQTNIK
ncbi:uncharacterized protein LOC120280295 isoform X2 [Dioscorea cayenensis subsp. rotundata]|uniref:Uncharacterized protein LOC120280295 isoform X2 n=1 Tax=Dioscorea cayennensis subsp. rotundata TaxID=55577 RepID=A0AB40CSZ8_DIOCR|nr:uncharacterized protein LOC120280295 isoform X2 [Dioscorea cayenensis subsp. rotundata]